MRYKRIVASSVLSLLLSFLLVYPNCIVIADNVESSNLVSTGQEFVANPNDLTVVKNVVGPDSKSTTPYTIAIKEAGSLAETSHPISAGSQTITGLLPGDYSISEPDSHSATSVSIVPTNFTITMGVNSISASFSNTGPKDTGTLVWDLYYAAAGSPMTGSKIATGSFGPITSGGSGTIQYALTASDAPGSYMFHVYESSGITDPGLWSGQIDVSATVAPNPVVTITNTYNSQSNGTLQIVKYLAGTALTPPTTGFKVRVTPAGGGSSSDVDIDSKLAKDISLTPGDYTINEFEALSADIVEYSTDAANWSRSLGSVTVAPGSTPTTVYIRNTFNIPTDGPTYTGDLNVIKTLTGTSSSPPTSGFAIALTPSSGGASINKTIASGGNLIGGLAIDNYALVETGTNGANMVEYSFDNATWRTTPGSVPIAPGSTTIYYIRNTFNDYTPDNPDSDYTENNPVPPRQPIKVPDQPQVFEPKKEIVITLPLEPIIVPDPVPELPYTGAAGMDMTWLGLLLAAGGMVLKRFRS